MKQFRLILTSSLTIVLYFSGITQEVTQWRGADRSGIYKETGLLKIWPESGPGQLWEYNGLGAGYGSPAITNSGIFVSGEIDTISYLFSLDPAGKLRWKSKIGKEWVLSYPGSRSTPTVVGDLVYITTGWGILSCFESQTGKERWAIDMMKELHGVLPRFGLAESVLVVGEKVFCTPGGGDTNVVALDRLNGKILWISKGMGEMSAYCSPILIKLPERDLLVTFTKTHLLGMDAKDGSLLWSYKQEGEQVDEIGRAHV